MTTHDTSGGNTRYAVRDSDGNEYTTFRPQIGNAAMGFEGKHARIEFHEQQRGNFTNVYLDKIESAPETEGGGDLEPDEVGWQTAVEAAPYLVSEKEEVPPEELFDKLKPFKDRVADDIKDGQSDDE